MFNIDDAVTKLAAWAEHTPEVLYLAAFGSRVRGGYRPDSDFDLAIEVAGEGGEMATFMANHDAWKAALEKLLGFSPIHLTPRDDIATALKDGESLTIFERPLDIADFSNVVFFDEP